MLVVVLDVHHLKPSFTFRGFPHLSSLVVKDEMPNICSTNHMYQLEANNSEKQLKKVTVIISCRHAEGGIWVGHECVCCGGLLNSVLAVQRCKMCVFHKGHPGALFQSILV
jgi:hypothetical protein